VRVRGGILTSWTRRKSPGARHSWQQAIEARDAQAVIDFLHDDYALVLVVPAAVTMTREEWVRVLADYVVHEYVIHEQMVDVVGDTAVILTLATQRATVLGQDRSGRFILSDTWLRDAARRPGRSGGATRRRSQPARCPALDEARGGGNTAVAVAVVVVAAAAAVTSRSISAVLVEPTTGDMRAVANAIQGVGHVGPFGGGLVRRAAVVSFLG
jgi:hypothetical protein